MGWKVEASPLSICRWQIAVMTRGRDITAFDLPVAGRVMARGRGVTAFDLPVAGRVMARGRHGCRPEAAPRTVACIVVRSSCSKHPAERCPSGLRSTPGKCVYGLTPYRGFESLPLRQHYRASGAHQAAAARKHCARFHGGPVGASATIGRKPRQVRKEATVSTDSGAGVTLAGPPPFPAPRPDLDRAQTSASCDHIRPPPAARRQPNGAHAIATDAALEQREPYLVVVARHQIPEPICPAISNLLPKIFIPSISRGLRPHPSALPIDRAMAQGHSGRRGTVGRPR